MSSYGRFLIVFTGAVLLLGLAAAHCPASIIADSVSEFSNVQGQDNWYYGYYTTPGVSSSFTQMTLFDSVGDVALGPGWEEAATQPPWTLLWATGGHPNGPPYGADHWAVRRWISEVNGTIVITGTLADQQLGGDGNRGLILVNGVSLFDQFIAGSDLVGINYSITVPVNIGDAIDFAIARGGDDILTDVTRFTATIAVVPEPSTLALGVLGVLGCCALARRRHK